MWGTQVTIEVIPKEVPQSVFRGPSEHSGHLHHSRPYALMEFVLRMK